MLSDRQREILARPLIRMRVIVLALVVSALCFLAVVMVVDARPVEEPKLALAGLLLTGAGMTVAAVLPNWAASSKSLFAGASQIADESSATKSDDLAQVSRLVEIYEERLISRGAILDFMAYLNLTFYLMAGQKLSIGIAVVMLLLILIQFPSRQHLEDWVAGQLRSLRLLH